MYQWLENSLDYGVSESDFWNMTLAELNRCLLSKRRAIENEERKRATYDYILADLIGRSVARVYSSSAKMPELAQAYPGLFKEQRDELSALRFKQFAESFNKRFEEVRKQKNE